MDEFGTLHFSPTVNTHEKTVARRSNWIVSSLDRSRTIAPVFQSHCRAPKLRVLEPGCGLETGTASYILAKGPLKDSASCDLALGSGERLMYPSNRARTANPV